MEKNKAGELKVVGVRLVKEPSLYGEKSIHTPEDAVDLIADELAQYDREVFCILNIKTNGQIINLNVCSVGTLNASLVSPREVMKSAILSNAAGFIAVHNHPSGNCQPSSEDIETTKRLMQCGEILDIRMLDHIIVAGETGEIFSLRSKGLLPDEPLLPGKLGVEEPRVEGSNIKISLDDRINRITSTHVNKNNKKEVSKDHGII